MLISEIVAKSGLTKDTIRFYEKKGLINVERSNSDWNNYKNYSSEVLSQLLLIKKAKTFGFTLNEIAELFELMENNEATCSLLSNKVTEKLNEIDQKIKELKGLKKIILSKVNGTNTSCASHKGNNCNTVELEEYTSLSTTQHEVSATPNKATLDSAVQKKRLI